jgi:hypothetical protein
MTPHNSAAVDVTPGAPLPPLTSWYAEGSSDGIGDRLLMFDTSGTPSLEMLRFRPEIAGAAGFEAALRARVTQLQGFTHPNFAKARAVEHLDGKALTLVSTHTPGKRLGEVLKTAGSRAGVHPAFAAWMIRDLTGALADLERQGDGVAHGGLTADRIVLTADRRLVIAEHVLGSALDRLRLSPARVWYDLGLIVPTALDGRAYFDERTDVIQLGWVVLSLLLGRLVTPVEYPRHVEELFDEFVRNNGRRSPALVPALRCWLERALRPDGPVFESAFEAHAALPELGIDGEPHAIDDAASEQPVIVVREPLPLIAAPPIGPLQFDLPQSRKDNLALLFLKPEAEEPVRAGGAGGAGEPGEAGVTGGTAIVHGAGSFRDEPSTHSHVESSLGRPATAAWVVAAVFALCALAEALVIASLAARPPVAPPAVVPITVESPTPGDPVIVDGKELGLTPLAVELTPATRSVRVLSRPVTPPAVDANQSPAIRRKR